MVVSSVLFMLDIEKYTFLERESIEESNYEPSFGQKTTIM